MQETKENNTKEIRTFDGLGVADIDIPNQHGRDIEHLLPSLVRYGSIWNRTICYLICSADKNGLVSAETPTIFNAIFSEHEIACMSHPANRQAMQDINNVKHWLYQRRIMGKSRNDARQLIASFSVFRLNKSVVSPDETVFIMVDQNDTSFSVRYKECVHLVSFDENCKPYELIQKTIDIGTAFGTEGGYLFTLRKYGGKVLAERFNEADLNLLSAIKRGWIIESGKHLMLNGHLHTYIYESERIGFIVFDSALETTSDPAGNTQNQGSEAEHTPLSNLLDKVKKLCQEADLDPVSCVHVEAVFNRSMKHLGYRYPDHVVEKRLMQMLHDQIKHNSGSNPYMPYIMLLHDLIQNDLDRKKK